MTDVKTFEQYKLKVGWPRLSENAIIDAAHRVAESTPRPDFAHRALDLLLQTDTQWPVVQQLAFAERVAPLLEEWLDKEERA